MNTLGKTVVWDYCGWLYWIRVVCWFADGGRGVVGVRDKLYRKSVCAFEDAYVSTVYFNVCLKSPNSKFLRESWNVNMPILRTLTTKIKTAISPSTSPVASPSSPTSGFEVVRGRKETGITAARPETDARVDSLMTGGASDENIDQVERKMRRVSRFREELDCNVE